MPDVERYCSRWHVTAGVGAGVLIGTISAHFLGVLEPVIICVAIMLVGTGVSQVRSRRLPGCGRDGTGVLPTVDGASSPERLRWFWQDPGRLHWFWRAAVAVGITYCVNLLFIPAYGLLQGIRGFSIDLWVESTRQIVLSPILPVSLALLALPIAIYAFLTRRYGPPAFDGETRCRHCQYILRGITEPRCPECGERI